MLLIKLVKIPLKVAALPIALALFLINVVCGILIGLSSIVTNLLSTLFFFGAAAGWINHAAPAFVWQIAGTGLFFLLAPHLANWLLNGVMSLLYAVLGFITA